MRCLLLLSFILAFSIPHDARAERSLGQKLTEHQKKQENLEQEVKKIERDLEGTRDDMVDLGKTIQSNEKTLQELETRIEKLEGEKSQIRNVLEKDRKSMADLILALERIRRVPPEAMIAKPGAPYKTAQSALLMGDIIPLLHKKAQSLKENLENIDRISADLEAKKEVALKASQSLEAEHEKLAEMAEKRERLFADTHADLETEKANVKRISKESRNLADLVLRLNESREKQRAEAPVQKKPEEKITVGQARLPISGIIRTRYDQPDSFGAPSKGISIEGREGALVVAPMGGTVRFAGHFKNYGNIVILEHEKGYHSLIAGLEKIDTVVGQGVSAGEALGLLHKASTPGERPALYYELRLDGRPVNPAAKFADLG
jgi:septal ring factor EnvC (AmiA/AmiB activator)